MHSLAQDRTDQSQIAIRGCLPRLGDFRRANFRDQLSINTFKWSPSKILEFPEFSGDSFFLADLPFRTAPG